MQRRQLSRVRSLQIKIACDNVRSPVTKARVVNAVKRAGEKLGLEKAVEDRSRLGSRGTVVEFCGDERPVLKAWVVDDHLMAVHARDERIAARVLKELANELGDRIESGEVKLWAEADVEFVGPKREMDKTVKAPWRTYGFRIEHDTVKKGGKERPLIRIKDASGRTVLKIYARAPRKRKWKVGGKDGAWGMETTARARVVRDTFSGHAASPEAVARRRRARYIARRLARNPRRAAEFVREWLDAMCADEAFELLAEYGIVRFPERVFDRMKWVLAADWAVRELLEDRRVQREMRRLARRERKRRAQRRLDEFDRERRGGGGPPN